MNRRLFIFVIILMGISLAGIILLQLFWIRNAISIREEHFTKTVNLALRETAKKIESHENIQMISDRFDVYGNQRFNDITYDSTSNRYFYNIDTDGSTSYSFSSSAGENSNVVVSMWTGKDSAKIVEYKHEVVIDSLRSNVARVKADIELDSLSKFLTHDIIYVGNEDDSIIKGSKDQYLIVKRAKDLNEAFIKMAYEIESEDLPIEDRVDSTLVDEVLSAELFNQGINIPFEFGVLSVDSLKSYPIYSHHFDQDELDPNYVVSLFPNELSSESSFLVVQFPGRNVHILKSMTWILASSLLLTLIILTTFGITIFMILRQKKLSDMKSDFINNMTHEFKTPIATISLATDSISNPKIISNEKEVMYYTDIIREENRRMNNQVENVLRMSLLDKHELEFNCIESDIHGLISSAVSKIQLQVKERKASIVVRNEAKDPMLSIDPDHFTNAILNLLDNALKYTEAIPEIIIKTADTFKGVEITVSDNGMGMSREVQARIFDKFYRKPSGNVHNIKGFGLGLSYVKAIIDAFGGSINVQSEIGKGSTFIIDIPRK